MKVPKGTVIIKEGSIGTSAYLILSGRAMVTKNIKGTEVPISYVGQNQIFGEMGLIEDKPRSASVRAMEDMELKVFDRKDFNEAFHKKPDIIMPIVKTLFERIRQMNEVLVQRDQQKKGKETTFNMYSLKLKALTKETLLSLGKKERVISMFPYKIGKSPSGEGDSVLEQNDLYLNDKPPFSISDNHCSINMNNNEYFVLDRGSSYGTIVNGERIHSGASEPVGYLHEGKNDLIIGPPQSVFKFEVIIEVGVL